MSLYLDDGDVRLYHGDALTVLRGLPPESVHMCVTSPPFYGLRSYLDDGHADKPLEIGLEDTPEAWVDSLVNVFREVRRVLRDDGTLWLEVGDSYTSGGREGHGTRVGYKQQTNRGSNGTNDSPRPPQPEGLKPKDLIGAPWQLAFALRADGWWLRSDIVWSRPNPMLESVTDRPTKSHSYVFLLSKRPRYFFDQEAVREDFGPRGLQKGRLGRERNIGGRTDGLTRPGVWDNPNDTAGRNIRSVWNIATQPYPEAHFATFPEELARRCILAGTSAFGACQKCGAPFVRKTSVDYEKSPVHGSGSVVGRHYETGANNYDGAGMPRLNKRVETTGWEASCECGPEARQEPYYCQPAPCVVLDPFVGSGTVPYVARKHGRHSIGIDLSAQYLQLASRRLQQLSLFAVTNQGAGDSTGHEEEHSIGEPSSGSGGTPEMSGLWTEERENPGVERLPGTDGDGLPMVQLDESGRPQAARAAQLFVNAGLTDAHYEAIRAVGFNDAGKAQVTQSGYGKNDPEVQRLADEAKAALGGYYREFLGRAGVALKQSLP